jgi:serine phosphatase RsbU (regulator of sigma subunit)
MQSNRIVEMEFLERFAASLTTRKTTIFQDVKKYVQWEMDRGEADFKPEASDDSGIRTYLLECNIQGVSQAKLDRIGSSLGYFYTWLTANGLISENPFNKFNLDWPALSQKHIRPRHDAFPGKTGESEIARLRALNQLAESTNRASDVQSMLNGALETLLGVMSLNTGWISLKYDSGFVDQAAVPAPEHGFALGAACNLPPSLEQSDRHYLRQPPMCNCQKLLSAGRMKRGVNMVECSRLKDAAKTSIEDYGLMFHASVPIVCNNQPVGVMNIAAKEWQLLSASDLQFLTAGARQVGSALERARLYDQVRVQHSHLKHELDMARKVQISLMPEQLPRIHGYEVAALWQPAYQTSGDYYNIFKLPGGRWGFMVADVCDKGAPAALYMALAHGILRERVEKETSPAGLLSQVNRLLYGQGITTNFITTFYGILDPSSSRFQYALAGHPQPLLRKVSGKIETLAGKGIALGVIPDAQYEDMELSIAPGESLVAYTDGMTDANNSLRESFQIDHLRMAIGAAPAPAKALLKHLQNSLGDWVKQAPNFDDITLLVIGRK